jgi:hypothetical protein
MKSSFLTAIGMVAALMLMTGCSDQSSQSAGEALPAPMDPSAANQPMAAQEAAENPVFAAFDADSNGIVDENEWQNREARNMVDLKNMSFHQIDRDSSGGIDPDEFDRARTDGGATVNTGGTGTTVSDSDADTPDAG